MKQLTTKNEMKIKLAVACILYVCVKFLTLGWVAPWETFLSQLMKLRLTDGTEVSGM